MDRFKKIYSQGVFAIFEIWVDSETGVNYIWHSDGNAGGLTPLLDETGKPLISRDIQFQK